MRSDPVFTDAARRAMADLYPEHAGIITHGLVGHPLFELNELVQLSRRIRPADVEQNIGDLPVGIDPAEVKHNGLSAAETIRSIEENSSWMVLKFVEQDPLYRDMLHSTLEEIRPVIEARTGPMLNLEGFVFISSPGAVTPFHFDPEHNILLQLRGEKVMTVFPADDEEVVRAKSHEDFHSGGHRNLPFSEPVAAKGRPFRLSAGEAIYVPVKAPHWVKNGSQPSVSFSVTWRSEWSYREADARRMNRILRQIGVDPSSPDRYPGQNTGKSLAFRAIRKARSIAGLGQ